MKDILDKKTKRWTINDINSLSECLAGIYNTFYPRNIIDDFTYKSNLKINYTFIYNFFSIGERYERSIFRLFIKFIKKGKCSAHGERTPMNLIIKEVIRKNRNNIKKFQFVH